MKKITLLFAMCVFAIGIYADKHLYLVPNSNWKQADARFAAYVYTADESEHAWYSMTECADEPGVYTVSGIKNDKYTKVIFCRMNPSTSENDWQPYCWNQTGNLTMADGNRFTVNDGQWGDNSNPATGVWSVNPYFLAGTESIAGSGKGWWTDARQLTNGAITVTVAAGTHKFKLTDSSWDNKYTYSDNLSTSNSTETITNDNDDNITFTTYPASTTVNISIDAENKITVVYAPDSRNFIVVGNAELIGEGKGWKNANADAAFSAAGSITFSNVAAGEHTFRVVPLGKWGTNHNYNNIDAANSTAYIRDAGGSDHNLRIVTAKTQDITINFDVTNNLISVLAEAPHYFIAGTAELVQSGDWSSRKYGLVNGTCTLTLAAGDHVFKVTDGYWNSDTDKTHEFTTLDENCTSAGAYTDGSIKFHLDAETNVTISIDDESKKVCVSVPSGETTAVEAVEAELDLNAPMFNVLGQQVNKEYKGIVIQNGVKYLR